MTQLGNNAIRSKLRFSDLFIKKHQNSNLNKKILAILRSLEKYFSSWHWLGSILELLLKAESAFSYKLTCCYSTSYIMYKTLLSKIHCIRPNQVLKFLHDKNSFIHI